MEETSCRCGATSYPSRAQVLYINWHKYFCPLRRAIEFLIGTLRSETRRPEDAAGSKFSKRWYIAHAHAVVLMASRRVENVGLANLTFCTFSSPEPKILLACGRNREALGATISGMRHRCRLRETGWAEFSYFLCYFKMVAPRALDSCRRPEGS